MGGKCVYVLDSGYGLFQASTERLKMLMDLCVDRSGCGDWM